jgi:acetyl esterase/lipase
MTALRALMIGSILVPAAGARADHRTPSGLYEVEVLKNVAYYEGKDADPIKHKLDLYLPKGQKNFPVLFFIHGGGWRQGDKTIYGRLGQLMAPLGVGTVIINYRLSPKVAHPAHIQDVARAFAWTVRNIANYGGRSDQIFVMGHSAGGHLAALLETDESHLRAEQLSASALKGVIPISGVYSVSPGKRFADVFGEDAEKCRQASPLAHVAEGLVPFLIIYADKDFTGCDKVSEEFCQALRKCRCDATTLKVKDRDHISIIRSMAKEDDPATQAVLRFIAKHSGLKLTARESRRDAKP